MVILSCKQIGGSTFAPSQSGIGTSSKTIEQKGTKMFDDWTGSNPTTSVSSISDEGYEESEDDYDQEEDLPYNLQQLGERLKDGRNSIQGYTKYKTVDERNISLLNQKIT